MDHSEHCKRWQYEQNCRSSCRELAPWNMAGRVNQLPAAILVIRDQLLQTIESNYKAREAAECFCGNPPTLCRGASWCSDNSDSRSSRSSESSVSSDGTSRSWFSDDSWYYEVWLLVANFSSPVTVIICLFVAHPVC
jgi:hypothetical protein